MEEDRHVVGPALVDRLPDILADKQRRDTEAAFVLRPRVVGATQGLQVDDFDVLKLPGAGAHGPDKHFRSGAPRVDVDGFP